MPKDEHRDRELTEDIDVEAVRGNLLKLLRLLAKEVARRLARPTDRGDVDRSLRCK